VLTSVCGKDFHRSSGRKRYSEGFWWSNGAEISMGGKDGQWWLQLPGSACRDLGFEPIAVIARGSLGRCTRLDICRDWIGPRDTFISDVVKGCDRGWMRGPSRYQIFRDQEDDEGRVVGEGVYLGSKKSPQFVRIYDKGLETAMFQRGEWVRFEGQLRDDKANTAAALIFNTDSLEDSRPMMLSILAGMVDFRKGDRQSRRDRLQQPAWWSRRWRDVEAVRLRMEREVVDLDRWLTWLRSAAGMTIVEAARRAQLTTAQVCAAILDGVQPNDGTQKNPVVDDLAHYALSFQE